MRRRNLLPVLLVGICAGCLAVSASAKPLCHDTFADEVAGDALDAGEAVTLAAAPSGVELGDEGVAAEHVAAEHVEELILPCAMVESDQLGPWCVDAAVYLVTTSGTLLCRVSLPAVDLSTSSSSDVEDRDPAPAPQRVPLPAPAGSLASALKDAAKPLVLESASSHHRRQQPPHPVYVEPPLVPG